ncbi:MAG: hypothetical protein Q9188_003388 [Gyalolechia gomerana]
MAGVKRASDGHASAPKRLRPSDKKQDLFTEEQLRSMTKDDLIAHILNLQSQITCAAGASPSPPTTPELLVEDIRRKVSKARDMMEKGIRSQMKWKPSCKTGNVRFSYSGVVASPTIFLTLFRLSADWKKKQIKLEPVEFQDTTHTELTTSIRYGSLNITGKNVTVRWDPEDLTFTVTGTYGL